MDAYVRCKTFHLIRRPGHDECGDVLPAEKRKVAIRRCDEWIRAVEAPDLLKNVIRMVE